MTRLSAHRELRERIARVIYDEGGYCGNCGFEGWDTCADCRRTLLGYADAVLDTLGLEQVGTVENVPDEPAFYPRRGVWLGDEEPVYRLREEPAPGDVRSEPIEANRTTGEAS